LPTLRQAVDCPERREPCMVADKSYQPIKGETMGATAVAVPKKREGALPEKREKEFREAVERVYRKYGRNLSAFLRDIQKENELLKKG
jgi:hypothetical protein